MTSHRTSLPRLAAAMIGSAMAVLGGPLAAQDLPVVRPSSEVFGIQKVDAAKSPFSVLEPDWEPAETVWAQPAPEPQLTAVPAEPAESPQLIPVQSLQLPDFDQPIAVDSAPEPLASPVQEVASLPKLAPLAEPASELAEQPEFEPKPAPEKTELKPASADELEGMLHDMVWVTATIGLGAVVSLWMLKLWLTRGSRTALPSKSLKLVDTLRIGPRCGVYLLQAETHRVLVGVEHGKTMCLMPLPESFTESLDAAEEDSAEPQPEPGFERVADVFSALRKGERPKGATS